MDDQLTSIERITERCGLITRRAVTRLVAGGDQRLTETLLKRLTRSRPLVRHLDSTGLEYFTGSRRPLGPRELASAYAVLAFSCYTKRKRALISVERYDAFMRTVADQTGVAAPAYRPCYRAQRSAETAPALSPILVGRSGDLQAAVEHIDRFLDSSAFAAWHHVARAGGLVLTFLLPAARERRDELGRWVRRREPVSRLGPVAASVPVHVFTATSPARGG